MSRSLVVPIYRNAADIPMLVRTLEDLSAGLAGDLEVVFVVDGSPDESGALLIEAARTCSFPSRIVFHSRNFGAFVAIRTGLEVAGGDHVAVMAADLQEPPALIAEFFRILAADEADVVFGKREGRSDPFLSRLLSSIFWRVYRRLVMPGMPPGGVDIFACNRLVREAVLSIEEPNSSLVAQLFWVGYRRAFVPYVRRKRERGKSAWKFSRRFRYMMDSILSFSDLPIMAVLWLGLIGCGVSVVVAAVTLIARLTGEIQQAGYASIVLLVLFLGSLMITVQGIIGCYVWRTAENTKKRPLRLVSQMVASPGRGGPLLAEPLGTRPARGSASSSPKYSSATAERE